MKKLEPIKPVLWFFLTLMFVGLFPLDRAAVALGPAAMDSGESRAVLDDSPDDGKLDALVQGHCVPAGTGIRSVYGYASRPYSGCGIACAIPDATGPPSRDA